MAVRAIRGRLPEYVAEVIRAARRAGRGRVDPNDDEVPARHVAVGPAPGAGVRFAMQAFGPKILAAFDVSSETANLSSALISLLFLIGCVLSLVVINRTGRRQLVIWSFLISGIGLLVVGFAPTAPMAILAAAFLAYALGIGGTQILQWIYPNELFPTEVRGTAVGIASSLSRVGAAVGTYLVPLALSDLGVGPTMLIGAGITLLGVFVSVLWAPETTNLALHEASALGAGTRSGSSATTPAAENPTDTARS